MALSTAELNKIYMEELGRPAAAEGISYWTQGGTSLTDPAQIRQAIAQSQEAQAFKSKQPVNVQPQQFTPQNYQDYATSLQGMTPAQMAKKIQEDTATYQSQGYTVDPNMISQYVAPTLQSALDQQVGLPPAGFGGTELAGSNRTAVGLDQIDGSGSYTRADVEPTFTGFTADEANQIYIDEVGRPLGKEGLDYWLTDPSVRENIKDAATLRQVIRDSEEAQNFRSTGVARTDYIPVEGFNMPPPPYQPVTQDALRGDLDSIYRSILGPTRGIQEEGLQYFTNEYNTYRQAGDTHEQALAKITQSVTESEESTQFQQAKETSIPYLQQYYTKYLGRQLGQEGQNYWTSEYLRLVREGTPESQALQMIEGMIAESEEAKIFANTGIAQEVVDPVGEMPVADTTIPNLMVQRAMQPALPEGGKTVAEGIGFDQATQQIGTGTGQVGAAPTVAPAATSTTAQATTPGQLSAQQYNAAMATGQMPPTAPAVGTVSAPMMAQTQVPSSTEVAQQQAAQLDQAVRVEAPAARQLSAQELVEAPADAQAAAAFAEQVQAAQAQPTPEATVQGQLTNLMAQFEDGQTPPWAAGAMRQATAIMAQRGLGASSMAGQAVIQAAMESALPIATQDAQTMAQFEMQNLSNRQARAMLAAQQRATFIGQEFDQQFQARVQNASRVADIANLNFSAEQQIALENAQLAQTVDLNNLSNRQAVQMANIAQIANLETTNLSNRQQAAVQNAQNFLQMDMANLSNEQQAVMFDAQSRLQTILSDQAADNASRQFNASSQNQVDQFFANLASQVSQFNATQSNAMEQFNIEQESAINKFNAELKNQRDQFNAQNQLIVAQSNAQWRRDIATADTAALNEANKLNAQAILGISEQAYANIWQAYEDEMEYAWQGGQNELDRINKLAVQRLLADSQLTAAQATADASTSSALGTFAATALFGVPGASGFKGIIAGLGG